MTAPDFIGVVTRRGTFSGADYLAKRVTGEVVFGRTWALKRRPTTSIRVTLDDGREAHGHLLDDGRAVLKLKVRKRP